MKLKHTEGPWRYTISKNGRRQISSDKKSQICLMWNFSDTEANAKLIVCAPDLIEDKTKDYKEIGKWLSASLEDPNVCDEMKQDIRNWFKRFDTFEKATGFKIEEVI